MRKTLAFVLVTVLAVFAAHPALANEFEEQLEALLADKLRGIAAEGLVIDAIKAQNTAHTGLDADAIDALDKQWRAEAKSGSGPLINEVLGRPVSAYLKSKKADNGSLLAEIFVMDNKGLNVGQSDVTSDYNQGDEGKFQKTFGKGAGAVLLDEVEFDDSTGQFISQVSFTIADPASGEAIGAVTFGVNVEDLL